MNGRRSGPPKGGKGAGRPPRREGPPGERRGPRGPGGPGGRRREEAPRSPERGRPGDRDRGRSESPGGGRPREDRFRPPGRERDRSPERGARQFGRGRELPGEERREARSPVSPPAPPPGARLVDVVEAEVTIEKLVAGGEGLARVEGVPLFVPRSAPGDRLRVRLVERRPDYGRAEIVEILEPGPGRRPDPYPFLSDWGGCDLQHLEDELQPRLKAAAVRETLERLGRVELPAEVPVITGEPWGYRLRTQLHTAGEGLDLRVGYHARGTNVLIPVASCPVLVPELEALLPELPGILAAAAGEGAPPRRLDLAAGAAGEPEAVTSAPVVPGLPHGEVTLGVGELAYAYDARCFFQAHRGLLPRLVETAVGPWTGEGEAFDLYAGVGLFALPLARRYGRVTAVEGDRIAARFARTNARRNRLRNVEVEPRALESWIGTLPAGVDRVVVDPPRAGLAPAVRAVLVERRPRRITYVSCHPATLARDLRGLLQVYALESLTLLDLFPQTGHMETVAQLALR
jgi:23S rRNA (uracil1939-C5)-methyltransferase